MVIYFVVIWVDSAASMLPRILVRIDLERRVTKKRILAPATLQRCGADDEVKISTIHFVIPVRTGFPFLIALNSLGYDNVRMHAIEHLMLGIAELGA